MKDFLQRNMGYVVSLLVVFLYFALSWLIIDGWTLNWGKAFMEGSLLYICSIIVNNSLMKQGIMNGKSNTKYQETVTAHLTIKKKVLPKIKYLQPWLNDDYYNLLEIGRSVYTNSAGYDYSTVFDSKGKMKKFEIEKPNVNVKWYNWFFKRLFNSEYKQYIESRKYINKAKRYNIRRLKLSDTLSIDSNEDPNYFGMTESQYEKRQSGMAIVSKLFLSFLVPSISFTFYGFSWATLITQMIGILLLIISSLFSMYCAYVFIVKNHRQTIINIINKLEEFDNSDLTKYKEKEQHNVCTEKSEPTEGSVVETIHGNGESGEENNLCSNTNTGV